MAERADLVLFDVAQPCRFRPPLLELCYKLYVSAAEEDILVLEVLGLLLEHCVLPPVLDVVPHNLVRLLPQVGEALLDLVKL